VDECIAVHRLEMHQVLKFQVMHVVKFLLMKKRIGWVRAQRKEEEQGKKSPDTASEGGIHGGRVGSDFIPSGI